MNTMVLQKRISYSLLMLLVVVLVFPVFTPNAEAAALAQSVLRFNRIQTSINDVGIVVMIEPAGSSDEDFIDIDFGAGIGVDGTASNITTNTTSLPAGCTSLSVGSSATNVTGQSVEFTISSPANPLSGTLYCFNITGGIDTPGSTGSYLSVLRSENSGHTEIESTNLASYFVANDQITVSAVVPATFSIALGANSTSFTADLSTSVTRSTTGVTGTIITNAGNGWVAYLRSANAALNSVITGDTIATIGSIDNAPSNLSTGAEEYVLDVDETADPQSNGAIDPEYDGSSTQGGTFNSSALEPIVSGSTATSGYIFTLVGKANISGLTQAANDYADTWTVVGAGNF